MGSVNSKLQQLHCADSQTCPDTAHFQILLNFSPEHQLIYNCLCAVTAGWRARLLYRLASLAGLGRGGDAYGC